MLSYEVHRSQQELHSPLPPADWAQLKRPTVVAVAITANSEMVMVLPTLAQPHGWIFPQGAIKQRNETLFQAATRVLATELEYPSDLFASREASLVGKAAADYDHGKQYYIVALPMRRWRLPQLNDENRKYCVVGGPGELMSKIGGCSRQKQELIQRLLLKAIEQRLLFGQRWCSGYAKDVIRSL